VNERARPPTALRTGSYDDVRQSLLRRGWYENTVGRYSATLGSPRVFAVDPTLTFRNFQLLKLKCDKLLSNFAINCKVRHYNTESASNCFDLKWCLKATEIHDTALMSHQAGGEHSFPFLGA